MAHSLKPYEVPLDPQLAQEILNIPLPGESTMDPPRTIGDRVQQAIQAVDDANEYLQGSLLASIVARQLMLDLKKRGVPSIHVRTNGTVILRVSYGKDRARTSERPKIQSTHRPDLPTLDALRKEASELGVDISNLGRRRRAIYDLLQKTKRENPVPIQESHGRYEGFDLDAPKVKLRKKKVPVIKEEKKPLPRLS